MASPPDPAAVFSVRIVSLDYYMATPIPDLDFSYSSFHGAKVEEVPVIRIFGSTPAGQKACLHVHRAMPYLYIACPDELLQDPDEGNSFIATLLTSLEKALKIRSAPKRQHVHGCSLVRAKKLYGYHPKENIFIKIYLYYPHEVSRAASLLLGGAILNKTFQPYESHVPYLLHFFVDYNLYGMGHIHSSNIRFRLPLPDYFRSRAASSWKHYMKPKKSRCASPSLEADLDTEAVPNPTIWTSSTVSSALVWPDSASGHVVTGITNLVKRQSTTMLEADSSVDDILNEKNKMYVSLSQTTPDVKMVQSLIPIWEEFEQSGMKDVVIPPVLGRPRPENVLRSFIDGLQYDNTLSEVYSEEAIFSHNNSAAEETAKLENSIKLLVDYCSTVNCREDDDTLRSTRESQKILSGLSSKENKQNTPFLRKFIDHELAPIGSDTSFQLVEEEDRKSSDKEALGLLAWLASSQAAEDLITDDELLNEAILSPLFPKKSCKDAIEIAHMDFERASQQECQDILDSVEDNVRPKGLKEQMSYSGFKEDGDGFTSGDAIHQIDGSLDENVRLREGDASNMNMKSERENSSPCAVSKCRSTRQISKRKENELSWGPLPLSIKKSEHEKAEPSENFANILTTNDRGLNISGICGRNCTANKPSIGSSGTIQKPLTVCSVRDLMRKKRCFRPELPESECTGIQALNDVKNNMMDIRESAMLNDAENAEETRAGDGYASSVLYPWQTSLYGDRNCFSDKIGDFSLTGNYGTDAIQTNVEVDREGHFGKCSSDSVLSSSPINNTCLEPVRMAFLKKCPSKEHVDNTLDDTPEATTYAAGQGLNELLPFFQSNYEDENQNKLFQHEESIDFRETPLGIPTHFQNDGSVLYVLTHALSPPSPDSVCQWLLQESRKTTSADGCVQVPSSKINDDLENTAEGFDCDHDEKTTGEVCGNTTPEDKTAVHLKPDSSQSILGNNRTKSDLIDAISSDGCLPGQIEGYAVSDNMDDLSQISGPSEKPKLTPLSQIGFRDPASVGGGQQLTIISLEVLAECRGDLRSDPQFDAINVISLAVEEDTNPVVELYVLMRGTNDEMCKRIVDGILGCNIVIVSEEKHLLDHFVSIISSVDPDILMGWEIQGGSLGFLAERSASLGISLLKRISRTPTCEVNQRDADSKDPEVILPESSTSCGVPNDTIENEWGRTHASGIHVGGRIVLNLWRLMRAEVKLNMYTIEAVAEEVLRRNIPSIPCKLLNQWFLSGPGRARHRCIEYFSKRAHLNLEIINQLDLINRTSELARTFGIDFFSVLSRGSQFRVESMLLRLAHTQNYLAISPGNHQVASQPAMECLPLVMEPESGFYADPVVVLDFQSLYPSMIIAYNLCYCTCLGKFFPSRSNVLGISQFSADMRVLNDLQDQVLVTPNGVVYLQSRVRKGILPRLLEEILSTRIMIKQAMKKLLPAQVVLERIFNARQLALKLIANVTYGYTAAGFSGRMPCAELADSIVQCGRRTLETAITFVNEHPKWKARVLYGDTDSMFVLLKGRSVEEAFRIGREIASAVSAMNPNPVTLKLEKVYHPCFLLTKKRYVGYSYESPDQREPTFDAKGIETVRRDTCPAVAKILERSIRLFFEDQDIIKVKSYLERQWTRIISGKVSLQDFIFAKEVRLGTYSIRASSLPPAAIVATKAMALDPRAEPRYAERVPYVVIHGEPGSRLMDMVVDPHVLLDIDSPYRLNDLYYIDKQIIPPLQRVFGLIGSNVKLWFSEMPRPARPTLAKRHFHAAHLESAPDGDYRISASPKKAKSRGSRIDAYYASKHCLLCDRMMQALDCLCVNCSKNEAAFATAVVGRTSKLEREMQHLAAICRHCGGADWIVERGVKCTSLACPVFYERRKVQKELRALSRSAEEAGYYPPCMAELF